MVQVFFAIFLVIFLTVKIMYVLHMNIFFPWISADFLPTGVLNTGVTYTSVLVVILFVPPQLFIKTLIP